MMLALTELIVEPGDRYEKITTHLYIKWGFFELLFPHLLS